jgi:hypothetical protein
MDVRKFINDATLVRIQGFHKPSEFRHGKHNIGIYHSPFIPEGVADASHIFLRDAYVLPNLFSYE